MQIYVGAAMSDQRIFVTVTGSEVVGGLFEYFWNGKDWSWSIHGQPPGSKIATAPSDAVDDSKFFVTTSDGRLFQRWWDQDAKQWNWQDHNRPFGVGVVTAPASMTNNKVFVTGEDGNLYQLFWDQTTQEWQWTNQNNPGKKLVSAPGAVMLDNKLFVTAQDGDLYQLNFVKGAGWQWVSQKNPGVKLVSTPGAPISNSKLFITGEDGNLYQLNFAEGEWQWASQNNPGVRLAPSPPAAMSESEVFVTGQDGNLYLLNFTSNEWQWAPQHNPGTSIVSAPSVNAAGQSQLFAGADGGQLYQLSLDNDTKEWKWDQGASIPLINHIFVLMLENRSFDHMLGFSRIKGTDAVTGLATEINGLLDAGKIYSNSYEGTTYPVTEGADEKMTCGPGHGFKDVLCQLGGGNATYPWGGPYPTIDNSGFVANYVKDCGNNPAEIMKCQSTSQVVVLRTLAESFAVCDTWYSSLPGPTWPNRYFLHAASSGGLDDDPTRKQKQKWMTIDGFGFENGTIFDALLNNGSSYSIYSGTLLAPVASLKGITVLDLQDAADFPKDVQSGEYSANYTFMEPCYGHFQTDYSDGNSQHPLDGVAGGEGLIGAFYEAVQKSPIWNNSLLIVTYDEHGGFYDHVLPGTSAIPPGDKSLQEGVSFNGFAFDVYGVRVPAVVMSPFIPPGTIDHRTYDHTSVAATVEALLGMPPLTKRDAAANNFLSLMSLRRPRTNVPANLDLPAEAAQSCPFKAPGEALVDTTPLDSLRVDDNLFGFLFVAVRADLLISPAEEHAGILTRVDGLNTRGDASQYMDEVQQKIVEAKSQSRSK